MYLYIRNIKDRVLQAEWWNNIKEKYKNFMYLELMPEDKNNVPFYEKHGFHVMENGAAMQICNIN